jgi:hypothetical protein
LAFPIFFSFISAFILNEYLLKGLDNFSDLCIFTSALIGAFVFTVNPWFATCARNISLRAEYSLLPLIFYFYIQLLDSGKWRNAIYLAMVLAFIIGWRSLIIVVILFFITFLVYTITAKNGWRDKGYKLSLLATSLLLFMLLSMARLFPPFLYSFYTPVKAVEVFSTLLLRRESILHIFTTKIYKYVGVDFELIYADKTHFLFIIISMFALIYTFFKHQKPFYHFFPSTVFIFFTIFTSKEVNIDNIIIFSDYLGRLFRESTWNVIPLIFSISIMVSYSSACLLQRFKRENRLPLIMVILLAASASSWPFFTGDMNGYWKPAKPPEDYIEVNEALRGRDGGLEHHVIWLPNIGDPRAVWSNQSGPSIVSAPTGIFAVRSSGLPTYDTNLFYFFDYYNLIRGRFGVSPSVYRGDVFQVYSLLNIKYVVIAYDRIWSSVWMAGGMSNEYLRGVAENISQKSWVEEIYVGRYLSAFELENRTEEFEVRKPVVCYKGLTAVGSVAGSLTGNVPALMFSLDRYGFVDTWIISPDFEDILLSNMLSASNMQMVRVAPKSFSKTFDPEREWSRANVDDTLFQQYMYRIVGSWGWDFDYGYGLVFTSARNAALTLSFDIDRAGDYIFFVRCFKSQRGGLVRVFLDENSIEINTVDQLNRFAWIRLGMFDLEAGRHKIVLENLGGFNAVNLFTLIPEHVYFRGLEELRQKLQSSTVAYIFEAESELYASKGRVLESSPVGNGELTVLTGYGRVWRDVEIVKSGVYKVALRGLGIFKVKTGGNSFVLKSDSLNGFTYSPSFYLSPGRQRLEITPLGVAKLDVVWLYSTETDQTIDQLFSVDGKSAEIVSARKIDPTLWRVEVDAVKPFLLCFAEAYDPLWEARIYKGGRRIKTVGSIPLYSIVNGFWIDEAGELEVEIRFKPQDWFEACLICSSTTFLLCVSLLIYDWVRKIGR